MNVAMDLVVKSSFKLIKQKQENNYFEMSIVILDKPYVTFIVGLKLSSQ